MSNEVSIQYESEKVVTGKTKIEEIRTLYPELIAIPAAKKKRTRSMGQKSVEYVNMALRGQQNFPQYMPEAYNDKEFEKDVALIAQLWELRVPLASLLESIDDTIFAASVDAMRTADEIYAYLKIAAKKDAAVKTLVDEMKKRYQRSPKKEADNPSAE